MATYRLTQLNRVLGPAILLVALVLAACAPSQPLATPTVAPTATPRPTVTPAATATPSQTPTPAFVFNPEKGQLEVSSVDHSAVVGWAMSADKTKCTVSIRIVETGEFMALQPFKPCTVEAVIEMLRNMQTLAPSDADELLDQAITELSR